MRAACNAIQVFRASATSRHASDAMCVRGRLRGAGAIVSLGAVVLADVPHHAIVQGNPAVVISHR